jgi:arginase
MRNTLFMGAPFSAGQPHRGVAWAPDEFRSRHPDLFVPGGWQDVGNTVGPHGGYQEALQHAGLLSERVRGLPVKDNFLAIMGGDHGLSLGTIHGLLHHHPELIVVWIDAHADANSPSSSSSGNMHGMPVAWLLGLNEDAPPWVKKNLHPQRLIYVGARALDPYEHMLLQEWDITWIKTADFSNKNVASLLEQALKRIDPSGDGKIHISLDVDALDHSLIKATGTRVEEGLTFIHVEQTIRALRSLRPVVSMEVVEINPELGSPYEIDLLMGWARDLFQLVTPTSAQIHPFMVTEQRYLRSV